MKVFLIFATIFVAVFGQYLEDDLIVPDGPSYLIFGINDKIAKALEEFRKQMPCGMPDKGVPPLAPLKHDYYELKYQHSLFDILGNFSDLGIHGLDSFQNNEITFSVLTWKGTFDINFKRIAALGDYKLKLTALGLFDFDGTGSLDFELENLRIKGDFSLGLSGLGLAMKTFNIKITLGDCKSKISGLLGAGNLTNEGIESFVKFFMENEADEISEIVREEVMRRANEFLGDLTIKKIIEMITAGGEKRECIPPQQKKLMDLLNLF